MLTDLFEFEEYTPTILVNISKETKFGNISERIENWLSQSNLNVYIGRGSPFGNPFSHSNKTAAIWKTDSIKEAISKYKNWFVNNLENDLELTIQLKNLKGKRLGCWCHPKPCHGNVILELLYL